ncbi:DUF2218 domain-containing protein [Marinovum sp.]|uniref:DUF2218 domain-containing protein n=1 Tax=Marinovum sp. TaxID=2024839 RepID=UPI002B2661A6|nr:DUF2218 domain-containing protein [Marinovum sp.]
MNATTHFTTDHAERYLGTLCKHFGHKVPVTHAGRSGEITLPFGACALTAEDTGLTMTAQAPDQAQLDRAVQVITSHLERFAFRENPELDWAYTPA